MSGPATSDPVPTSGMARERTSLAWRRTALAAAAAGLVTGRVALETSTPSLALPVGGCLVASGALCWAASPLLRRDPWAGAWPLAVLALLHVVGGLGAVAIVLA